MPELINKWAVVSKLIDLENEFQHYKPFEGFEHAMYRKVCELENAIGKTPGVELIRCKNCKFWSDGVAGCTDHVKICTVGFYMIGENGFCSFGERKNEPCETENPWRPVD